MSLASTHRFAPSRAAAPPSDRLRLRDYVMIAIVTFPVFGTLFPVGTYFSTVVTDGQLGTMQSSGETTVVMLAILAYVIFLFGREMPHALINLRRSWPILLYVLWMLCTSRWSEMPTLSFNRSVRILIFGLYAIYIVEFYDTRRAAKILFFSLGISLCISLLIIAGIPSLARTPDSRGLLGTWRGAMAHKNSLGTIAALGFLYACVMWASGMLRGKLTVVLAVVALLLLPLANSVTAIISAMALFGIMFYFFYIAPLMRDRLVAIVVAIVYAMAGGLAIYSMGSILEVFGRDSTLTGRTEVWAFANLMIEKNPIWGYGHGAWGMPIFSKIAFTALRWPSPHAHSYWIDLRLQLGLPGFIIGVVMWLSALANLIILLMTRRFADFAFPMSVFILIAARSYSETILLEPALGDMFWFAFASASMAKLVSEGRTASQGRALRGPPRLTKRFGAEPYVPVSSASREGTSFSVSEPRA